MWVPRVIAPVQAVARVGSPWLHQNGRAASLSECTAFSRIISRVCCNMCSQLAGIHSSPVPFPSFSSSPHSPLSPFFSLLCLPPFLRPSVCPSLPRIVFLIRSIFPPLCLFMCVCTYQIHNPIVPSHASHSSDADAE